MCIRDRYDTAYLNLKKFVRNGKEKTNGDLKNGFFEAAGIGGGESILDEDDGDQPGWAPEESEADGNKLTQEDKQRFAEAEKEKEEEENLPF